MDNEEFIKLINDPDGSAARLLGDLRGKKGKFFLCLGATETSDRDDISAAGATPEMRRLTAAIDAEALVAGKTISHPTLPVSPRGIVSPVVITRACLELLDIDVAVVDCGTFAPPAVHALRAGDKVAKCVSTGQALLLDDVASLFARGKSVGREDSHECDFVVVAECVPGGTTTAMGVLTALGWDVGDVLSSSLPQSNHGARRKLVIDGLKRSGWALEELQKHPFSAVAAVGDTMQPFAAGLAIGAGEHVPVILAGGSQMLAVFALIQAFQATLPTTFVKASSLPVVATTKWVAFDPTAKTGELSVRIGAPYLASAPNFQHSRHPGLRVYEEGNVKEGVGAGAAMMLARAAGGATPEQIQSAIDDTYDELVGTLSPTT
ncbi:MAG TPA: TIGR00303 family protein [Planktothrix sp.]